MLEYKTGPVYDIKDMTEDIEAISVAVAENHGINEVDLVASVQAYAKVGSTGAYVYDNGKLVGMMLISTADLLMAGSKWVGFRLWAAKNGHDLKQYGCLHTVYVHPDYLKQGVTRRLREEAQNASPFSHTVAHTFPTAAIEEWTAGLPGVVDTGQKGPNGDRVFITEVIRE